MGALSGPMAAAEIRLLTARAEEQERKNKAADGEVIDRAEWEELWRKIRAIICGFILTLPDQATNCNPTDPTQAREQLQQWVNDTLKMLPEKIG